jgi:mannose-1-phosphate guanylyltransferase/mannose-6-phosphate isomerase
MNDDRPPIVPVILSGGSGTRLWPVSRERQPKQLLPIVDDRSMIHATIERVTSLPDVRPPIVVTNTAHAIAVERSLKDAGYTDATVILEPLGRNTAPAVAVASIVALGDGDDPLILVLPADHVISEVGVFADAVETAAPAAAKGYLVTFGISPTSPETGYGYIRSGEPLEGPILRIDEFKEKPDAETAARYVASGEYSWNSGMFLFRASSYLEELESFRPELSRASRTAVESGVRTGHEIALDTGAFAACPSDSIDYAVMEHTDCGAVLPIDPGWSDVGSWSSLWEIAERDDAGNARIGDVLALDTTDSYLRGSERVVAVIGLDSVVVVDTPDAVLVGSMDAIQGVKDVVERLKAANRHEIVSNGTEFEQWGVARLLDATPGHRTHLVQVDPLACIPPHTLDGRSEHWQVVSGQAEITVGSDTTVCDVGASIHVPAGAVQAIENPGETALMLIRISVDTHVDNEVMQAFARRRGQWK